MSTSSSPNEATHHQREVYKIRRNVAYFLDTYGQVYDATTAAWVPFRLWPEQVTTLRTLADNRLVVILKARQLGLTWLVLGFALWLLLFHPAATVLLFSRRDDEAVDLLATRLRRMYDRLPSWMKVRSFVVDNDHEWELSNGSRALAFPTTAGDSYTATLAIVDEADLTPDLDRLMRAVKPTIDGGGRMILLSRADKSKPLSPFKKIYQAAKQKLTDWVSVFLPWHARPDRDQAWYAAQAADVLHRTGALDDLLEQYPATDAEALAPRSLDKRIPADWLLARYESGHPLDAHDCPDPDRPPPAIPGLVIYSWPEAGRSYVIGGDPAEGNPTSDDSALTVLDVATGEEVATLAGKLQPSTLAMHLDAIGCWFNNASLMVERNNHGHAVIQWLREHSRLKLLCGHDLNVGWLSSGKGKALLFDAAADAFRNGETLLHTFATFVQLSSIDGNTLRAPENENDDRAIAYALALAALARGRLDASVANAMPMSLETPRGANVHRGPLPQQRQLMPEQVAQRTSAGEIPMPWSFRR